MVGHRELSQSEDYSQGPKVSHPKWAPGNRHTTVYACPARFLRSLLQVSNIAEEKKDGAFAILSLSSVELRTGPLVGNGPIFPEGAPMPNPVDASTL